MREISSMWRTAWNSEFDNRFVNCAILLNFNISSAILCANLVRNCTHSDLKCIFRRIDGSINLFKLFPKHKLHSAYFCCNKYVRVPQVYRSQGLNYNAQSIFYKSYVFSCGFLSKEAYKLNKYKLIDEIMQVLGCHIISKFKLLTEIGNCFIKYIPAASKNIENGMSDEQMPLSKKTKMSDDDCIEVPTDSVDNSEAVIVFEKLNNVEIMKEASTSSINSQSLQKTQIVLSESKTGTPEPGHPEVVRRYSFDSNKVRRKLSRLHELRRWEYTTFGKGCDLSGPTSSNKQYFTVMSYNVLSQELLESHPYLYYEHDPRALSWEWRSEKLLEEIKQAAPDILCLQEVQESHLNSFYMPRLQELGYNGIFKKRTGNKPDGVAIYFKLSAFSLVEHTSVEFMQPILPVLNRDNVALIVRLSSKSSSSLPDVCVATTHLLYNPKRMDVKLAQMQLLLAEIERMAFFTKGSQPSYYPLILTGDLNVTPKSSVYRLLTSGNLRDSDVTDEMIDILGITDNCQHFSILNSREKSKEYSADRISELRQLKVLNSDNAPALHKMNYSEESSEEPQEHNIERNKGQLSHNFILNSVYEHRNARGKEATTNQDRWVTVDYIFYSCSAREKNLQPIEGNLKLVARYGLLSKHECYSYGPIPNSASPSDHFPLISKFLLLP